MAVFFVRNPANTDITDTIAAQYVTKSDSIT